MVSEPTLKNPPSKGASTKRSHSKKRSFRRIARELALKIIYDLDDQEGGIRLVLDRFWGNFRFADDELGDPLEESSDPLPKEIQSYTEILATGVSSHLDSIDGILKEYSTNWTLERMARVDRAILRIGTYELLFCPQVPSSVVINEAIEIGKRFGTKETPSFVNGILDQIARRHRES